MSAPEPKAPASDLDAAVGRVTQLAHWASVRKAATNAPAEGHPGQRIVGWRIEMSELEKMDGLGLSGPTMLLGRAADDLRLILDALSSQSQAAEGLIDALVQADLTIRSQPGCDQSHVEFIRTALSHHRNLGDRHVD